jgi:hypothetical protein
MEYAMRSRLSSSESGAIRYAGAAFVSAAVFIAAFAGVAQGKENPSPMPGAREVAVTSTAPIRVQPNASEVTPPQRPDVSASDAKSIDELYRRLMGPDPDSELDIAQCEPRPMQSAR